MPNVITNPSNEFPGQPKISATLPEGWKPLTNTGFALAAGAEVPEGQFMPNVLVSIKRYPAGTGLEQTKAEIQARCANLPEFALAKEQDYEAQGHPGYRIAFAYSDPRAGTLLQSGRAIVVNHGAVEDVISITSTCAAGQADKFFPEIQAFEDSVTIN